ncbi:MAG: hypothetical protein KBT28_04625 [Bacteroidales bacterium]|nr:hypothetical protein [Candidatus Colimorpha merdihippi]
MNYLELVRNAPKKSEAIMWQSVENVSELVELVNKVAPDIAKDFLRHEYEMMYGPHFSEQMAKDEVEGMHHYANDGTHVVGEVISYDEAVEMVSDMPNSEEVAWDAYVGANGFAHDLARSCTDKAVLLSMAKEFWFHDDDFPADTSKVWWYYSSK